MKIWKTGQLIHFAKMYLKKKCFSLLRLFPFTVKQTSLPYEAALDFGTRQNMICSTGL